MLDAATTKMRQAMSLPNILFGVESEEVENLVEEDDDAALNEDEKKPKKKWFNRLPNPGNLLSPLRRSFTKLKRKHDKYETAEESSETSTDISTAIEGEKDDHGQFNYLSEKKLSISDSDIPYFVNEQLPSNELVFESDGDFNEADLNRREMKQYFGDARALVNNRVSITAFLGRYRKL